MTEQLHNTSEAAAALDVPADVISKWRHRGRVLPVSMMSGAGRGGQGAPLYRLEELRPLAEAYHQRATTRRNRH